MVKSHAEIHTNPRREVARFSESHLSCAAENGIDAHLIQARTVLPRRDHSIQCRS
jgi:hypothetical protein